MATPLEALQNRASILGGSLNASDTAYAPNTEPTSSDVSRYNQLSSINKQIETLKSKQLRSKWYGPTTANAPGEDTTGDEGILMGTLKTLQKPLNAVAGAAQYAVGKGTESSLVGNINQAMKTGTTFGTVLNQMGAPRVVQIPLGFALDVMFDPVNWATVGSSALIPRIGGGLVGGMKKAGIEGALSAAKTGLTSSLEKKAVTLLNLIPFAKKSGKFSSLLEKLGMRAVAGAEKYDTLVGKSIYDKLGRGIFGMKSGYLGDTAENLIRKIPSGKVMGLTTPSGEQIVDFFKYSPKQAAQVADLKDKVTQLAGKQGAILTRSEGKATFQDINEFLHPEAAMNLPDKLGESLSVAIRNADGTLLPEYANQVKVYDSMSNAQKLLEAAGEDYNIKHLVAAYKETPIGMTGVKWYDDAITKLRDLKVGDMVPGTTATLEQTVDDAGDLVKTWNSYGGGVMDLKPLDKLLGAQKALLSVFKLAKVPMNAASHVVANIGNLFMGSMMGLPMWEPEMIKSITKGSLLVKGRLGATGLRETFFNDANSWVDFLDKNPARFRQLTGMDPSEIVGKLSAEQKVMGVLGTSAEEVKTFLSDALKRIDMGEMEGSAASFLETAAESAADWEKIATPVEKAAMKQGIGKYKTASETLASMAKEAPIRGAEQTGSWTAGEIMANTKLDQFKAYIADQAAKNPLNPVARLANTVINSMPRWYEHIDQSFKIGTTDYLSRIGLTEQQLRLVSRSVSIVEGDLLEPLIEGGQKMYRLTPLKASEVATEAFMNYAGMPDFVKVMRALPVVGSPFLSFPYAMAIKTAKTAINNPAIFNKVGFMLNEITGARTPAEKVAMQEKYNQYLNSPTVVKIFGMWNTDVKNMIPYFQMNMLNPSNRTYDDSPQGKILKYMDKIPAFQDPVGSTIKDYFIQPWILSGTGQVSQGQFGQPIYPAYDENGKPIKGGLGTRTLYAGRTLAESMVPGVAGYAGLANMSGWMSPEKVNLVPSYGFRNLANAMEGRSSIGAMTKEDAVRKSLRSILGRTGIPAYTLDTTKLSTK